MSLVLINFVGRRSLNYLKLAIPLFKCAVSFATAGTRESFKVLSLALLTSLDSVLHKDEFVPVASKMFYSLS